MSKGTFAQVLRFQVQNRSSKCNGRVQRWLGRWKLLPKIMSWLLHATAECLSPLGRWMCLSRKYTAREKRDLADLSGWASHISDKWTLGMLGRWILTLGWVTPKHLTLYIRWNERGNMHLGLLFSCGCLRRERKGRGSSQGLLSWFLSSYAVRMNKVRLIDVYSCEW